MGTAGVDGSLAPASAAEREKRTGYLELFFDLVFVFAITQVTTLVLSDTSPAGFARAGLMLGLVWWAWSTFAWMTNAVDVENPIERRSMLLAMLGIFFVAIALPDAFTDGAVWFAVPYFAVRVLHMAIYLYGVREDTAYRQGVLFLAPAFLGCPALVLAASFLDDPWRTGLWTCALVVELTFAALSGDRGFTISPAHFAERHALFIIIALGESIVAIGIAATAVERDAALALAVVIAFGGAAAMWYAYFDFISIALERALARRSEVERPKVARDVFTYLHLVMVAGVILYAVAAKKMVGHPGDELSAAGRFSLGAGIGLYLVAFVLARYRLIRTWAWERIAGAVGVAAAALLLGGLPAAALVTVVVAVLLAAISAEARRLRDTRAQIRAAAG